MLTDREVLSTINMLRSEHLDVRTVTMGINLFDCASSDFDTFAYKVRSKIFRYAEKLVETCDLVGDRYGIPRRQQAHFREPDRHCRRELQP